MKKEKQLLADAKLWFEQKYGKTPNECGIKFIKIWHKPTLFKSTLTVVFAQTEKQGNAFIWEQNVIWRSIKNIWFAPVIFIAAFFAAFTQETKEAAISILTLFCILAFCAVVFFLYLARKCKKLEKIHQWNVDVYYA